ncbi:NAD-dependent epimerase/dehydratase family protein [Amycolatopsis rubida]|uniref:Nucleoside-diphosphate-sugar epimerase n=1 Tax=Amycolatopsis rubida TaxID=112413 RepID=A0A1I5KJ03_9PSEU|nr:NAD-dependent epimerase/dehydratase family protein [Amycolatopsis rubida]SFO84531.1 Nucleoside-diphosphate-sugar epimerase [Amycolatopsis rubida]
MRIVITGASGNLGTALLRALEPGCEIVGVARRTPGREAEPYSRAKWQPLDVGEPGAARRLAEVFAGADAVVHLAWAISPAWDSPPMWRTNDHGTRHVLEAVAKAGVGHLVCASSVAAYSPGPRDQKVAEDWPRGGIEASAYSRGKAGLETMLDGFSSAHAEVAVARIRPCAVVQRTAAGEFARWTLGPLVPQRMIGGRLLPVPLWAGLRAQAVHADDVAEAIRLVLGRRARGAFNIAAEDVLDAAALGRLLGGRRVPAAKRVVRTVVRAGWRAGLQPLHPGWLELADRAALVDTAHAKSKLGWQPRHSSAEAIQELVAGLRGHDRGQSAPLAPPQPGFLDRARALTRGRPARQSQD